MIRLQDVAATFARTGFFAPISVLPPSDADGVFASLRSFERTHAPEGLRNSNYRYNTHLVDQEVHQIVTSREVVDSVAAALDVGPAASLLLWSCDLFWKDAHSPEYVSWHQDALGLNFEPPHALTAWIALTPSTHESGGLEMIPHPFDGASVLSHAIDTSAERDTNNMLSLNQTISSEHLKDFAPPEHVNLEPGQMSMHHIHTIHSSRPNCSDLPRVGIALRFARGDVRQMGKSVNETATLLLGDGTDAIANGWLLEPTGEELFRDTGAGCISEASQQAHLQANQWIVNPQGSHYHDTDSKM